MYQSSIFIQGIELGNRPHYGLDKAGTLWVARITAGERRLTIHQHRNPDIARSCLLSAGEEVATALLKNTSQTWLVHPPRVTDYCHHFLKQERPIDPLDWVDGILIDGNEWRRNSTRRLVQVAAGGTPFNSIVVARGGVVQKVTGTWQRHEINAYNAWMFNIHGVELRDVWTVDVPFRR